MPSRWKPCWSFTLKRQRSQNAIHWLRRCESESLAKTLPSSHTKHAELLSSTEKSLPASHTRHSDNLQVPDHASCYRSCVLSLRSATQIMRSATDDASYQAARRASCLQNMQFSFFLLPFPNLQLHLDSNDLSVSATWKFYEKQLCSKLSGPAAQLSEIICDHCG